MHVEASIMTLHRFGNTSSSSIWYKLAYTEAKGIMRKGNRVWQIVFGRGFKCNRAVWQALRHVKASPKSPWKDCIHRTGLRMEMNPFKCTSDGKHKTEKLEELGNMLTGLDAGDSIVIAKSFSHMLNLANLAEEVQIAYRRSSNLALPQGTSMIHLLQSTHKITLVKQISFVADSY
ncbi:hypothetical protein AHAS_Ahas04G0110800 [Arachis hypogaea]